MPDLGRRDQIQNGIDHAQSRTEDRDETDLLREPLPRHRRQWRNHFNIAQLQILSRLIHQQFRESLNERAELNRRRRFVAQSSKMVLDERMTNFNNV